MQSRAKRDIIDHIRKADFAFKEGIECFKQDKKLSIIEETELIAEELRLASKHISNITTLIDNEDVLDKIFSNFCIGK